MKNDEKSMTMTAGDVETRARVVESLVLRGDLSGLKPADRARYYVHVCEQLGLNANAKPFDFLRLNGKEILYANKGATDQLAAIHHVNREIIDGPKVIDLAGTKLVYAVCKASLPSGRFETATATVPLADPMNVLMKCETKAKRRATMSILGLALLDEMELETIPASVQEPGGGVDLSLAHEPADAYDAETHVEVPAQLASFYERIADIELPGEAVAVWMRHRADLAPLPSADRETAWKALCRRTEEVGKMKNAKVWLKKAIAEEDARRGIGGGVDPQASLEGAGSPRAELADLGIETPRALPETAPAPDATDILGDIEVQVCRCGTVGALADLWIAARDEVAKLSSGAKKRAWTLVGQRATAIGSSAALVRAEVERRDTPTPPTPTGSDPSPAQGTTEASGETVATTPSQGAQASTAWRETAEGITGHVASKGAMLALERSGRLHLREISEALQRRALNAYAERLRVLSRREETDADGEKVVTETPGPMCLARAERWLREGPVVSEIPARRAKGKAA